MGFDIGFAMGLEPRFSIGGWSRRSQERAVVNAREATTALSRRRVEREEVELFLRGRTAAPAPAAVRRPA